MIDTCKYNDLYKIGNESCPGHWIDIQYIEKSLACLSFIIVHAWNVFHRGGFHLGSEPLFLKPSIIKLQAFMVFPFSRLWFQSLIIKSLQHLFQQEISNTKKNSTPQNIWKCMSAAVRSHAYKLT